MVVNQNKIWPLNLIAMIGLLSAITWNLLWHSPEEQDLNPALFPSPLGETFLNALAQMSISNAQGLFVLVNNGDRWDVSSPGEFPLDEQILPQIRSSLGPWEIINIFKRGPKLPQNTGLESPFATVTLIGQDQTRKEILWGLSNPVNQTTFVEIKGAPYVYLIKDPQFSLGALKLEDLRVLGPWAQIKNARAMGPISWEKDGKIIKVWNESDPKFNIMKELRAARSFNTQDDIYKELEKIIKDFQEGKLELSIPGTGSFSFLISKALSSIDSNKTNYSQGRLIRANKNNGEIFLVDEKHFITD